MGPIISVCRIFHKMKIQEANSTFSIETFSVVVLVYYFIVPSTMELYFLSDTKGCQRVIFVVALENTFILLKPEH
jgi:hypothetical protein